MKRPKRRSQIFKLKNRTYSTGSTFAFGLRQQPPYIKRERSVSGDSPRVCALSGPHVGGVTWAALNNFSSLGTHARTQSAKLQAPTTGEKGARRVCRPQGRGLAGGDDGGGGRGEGVNYAHGGSAAPRVTKKRARSGENGDSFCKARHNNCSFRRCRARAAATTHPPESRPLPPWLPPVRRAPPLCSACTHLKFANNNTTTMWVFPLLAAAAAPPITAHTNWHFLQAVSLVGARPTRQFGYSNQSYWSRRQIFCTQWQHSLASNLQTAPPIGWCLCVTSNKSSAFPEYSTILS